MDERKMVFWDVGGVLLKFNSEKWRGDLAKLMNTTSYELMKFLHFRNSPISFFESMETYGSLWSTEFVYEEFINYFGISKKDVTQNVFNKVYCGHIESSRDISEIQKISYTLHENHVEQGILSNITTLHAECVKKFLDCTIIGKNIPAKNRYYSFDIGARKSEYSVAFSNVCKLSTVSNSRACLIDDNIQNIRGVLKCGGNGILYLDPESTRVELVKLGFLS